MATSTTTKRALCKVCSKAPSIFCCQGCQKDFCRGHAEEHRQELSKQLDTVIVDHDQLKQNLTEYKEKSNRHPLMQEIDQWETQSIEEIRKVADKARKELSKTLDGYTTKISDDLKQFTHEVTAARSEGNFIEIDLKEWTEKLEKWANDLRRPSSIDVQQETSNTLFIQNIIFSTKRNDFFERSTTKMKIDENGRVVIAQRVGHSTARCHNEYSSGQYALRFTIEQMNTFTWMHFGIVSKTTPLQEASYSTPTNFGWITNGCVIINGFAQSLGYHGYVNDVAQNDTIELFLDCDRQKICLTNERTNNKHELDVNVTQCPFPWQLQLGLYQLHDRIRCLT